MVNLDFPVSASLETRVPQCRRSNGKFEQGILLRKAISFYIYKAISVSQELIDQIHFLFSAVATISDPSFCPKRRRVK